MIDDETLQKLQADAKRLERIVKPHFDAAEVATRHLSSVDLTRMMAGSPLFQMMDARNNAINRIVQQSALWPLMNPNRSGMNLIAGHTQQALLSAMEPLHMTRMFDGSWIKTITGEAFRASIWNQLAFQNVSSSALTNFVTSLGTGGYLTRFFEQMREPLRAMQELFEQYEEDERHVLEVIAPLGWLLSPSMDMRAVRRLAEAVDESSPEAIDEALVAHFDSDRCAEIVEALYDDPAFAARRKLLDQAMEGHRAGLYMPAILSWLATIDGVAAERYGVREVFMVAKRKNGGKLRVVIEEANPGREAVNEALIEILQRTAATQNPDPHLPTRDHVMHGNDADFGDERTSIQLILVLEVLHYCAPSIETAPAELPAAS